MTTKKTHKILLPQTEKEFDDLVKLVVKIYKIENEEHAAAIIANRIMHLPPEKAYAEISYFGECIKKNIAYQVAQSKGSRISHKHQIDQLVASLKANPMDIASKDMLQKAANEGSTYAKTALDEINALGPDDIQKVVSLVSNHQA